MIKFIVQHLLFFKQKKNLRDFPKLVEVAVSCNTKEQCITAMRYAALYNRKYNTEKDTGFEIITTAVLGKIISYLQDTVEHDEYGYHRPEWNEYKTVRYHPDLTDYLAPLMGEAFKIRKTWVRGKTSFMRVDN